MEKKTYTPPKVSEIGSINDTVNASRVSLVSDGVTVAGDKVLITLTKSDI